MARQIGEMIGATTMFLLPFWCIAILGLTLAFPVMCVSVVRNIRKIARELERANDYREHYNDGIRSGPLGT